MADHRPDTPSMSRHKRQFAWQVLVPVILFTLVIIALAVFIGFLASNGSAVFTPLAEGSTIWLVIPVMGFALALLALLVAMIYGMAKLLQVTPRFTQKTQEILQKIETGARKVTDGAVKPIVLVNEGWAAVKRVFKFGRRAA